MWSMNYIKAVCYEYAILRWVMIKTISIQWEEGKEWERPNNSYSSLLLASWHKSMTKREAGGREEKKWNIIYAFKACFLEKETTFFSVWWKIFLIQFYFSSHSLSLSLSLSLIHISSFHFYLIVVPIHASLFTYAFNSVHKFSEYLFYFFFSSSFFFFFFFFIFWEQVEATAKTFSIWKKNEWGLRRNKTLRAVHGEHVWKWEKLLRSLFTTNHNMENIRKK